MTYENKLSYLENGTKEAKLDSDGVLVLSYKCLHVDV